MTTPSSIAEYIAAMPAHFIPANAAGLNAVLQLDLSGEGGGQWHLDIADGTLTVVEGIASNANMILNMDAADFLDMLNGIASPMNLFMSGKIKIKGDMNLAMKMQSMFRRDAK